jgi:hypothetical protein
VKDWAKPPSDHVDLYHLGIRFVGFITTNLLLRFLYWFAEFSDQPGLFSSSVAEDRIMPFVDPIKASYKFVKKIKRTQSTWSRVGIATAILSSTHPPARSGSISVTWPVPDRIAAEKQKKNRGSPDRYARLRTDIVWGRARHPGS